MPKRIFFNNKTCLYCNNEFNRNILPSGRLESSTDFRVRKFCSHLCFTKFNTGLNHFKFNPNGNKRYDGYIRISDNGKRKYLHRVIIEKKLGFKLNKNQHIHHKDGINNNNELSNLEVLSNSEHLKIHNKTRLRDSNGRFIKKCE